MVELDNLVRRDVALAMQAWMHGDRAAVADIIRTCPDTQEGMLLAVGAAATLLARQGNPNRFIAALLDDELASTGTAMSNARVWLLSRLGDGRKHLNVSVHADAIAAGQDWKACLNAAMHMGIKREESTWQLPPNLRPGIKAPRKAQKRR